MEVEFISQGALNAYCGDGKAEVLLFSFNGMGVVRYECELKGESSYFEQAAQLSKQTKGIVVCGCITDTRGDKRKSALVAENGRLLGVTDRIHSIDGDFSCGATVRVYDTKIGKMGVLVAEDLYFYETVKALTVCGSQFIVCPFDLPINSMETAYLRVYAHAFGIPLYLCGKGYSALALPNGELAFSSPVSPVKTSLEKGAEYHLIQTRKRFIYQGG